MVLALRHNDSNVATDVVGSFIAGTYPSAKQNAQDVPAAPTADLASGLRLLRNEFSSMDYVLGIIASDSTTEIDLKRAKSRLSLIERSIDEAYYHESFNFSRHVDFPKYARLETLESSVTRAISSRTNTCKSLEAYFCIGYFGNGTKERPNRPYETPANRQYFANLRSARKGLKVLWRKRNTLENELQPSRVCDDEYNLKKYAIKSVYEALKRLHTSSSTAIDNGSTAIHPKGNGKILTYQKSNGGNGHFKNTASHQYGGGNHGMLSSFYGAAKNLFSRAYSFASSLYH